MQTMHAGFINLSVRYDN